MTLETGQGAAAALRRIAREHEIAFGLMNEPVFEAAISPADRRRLRDNADIIAIALREHGFRFVDGRWVPPVVPVGAP